MGPSDKKLDKIKERPCQVQQLINDAVMTMMMCCATQFKTFSGQTRRHRQKIFYQFYANHNVFRTIGTYLVGMQAPKGFSDKFWHKLKRFSVIGNACSCTGAFHLLSEWLTLKVLFLRWQLRLGENSTCLLACLPSYFELKNRNMFQLKVLFYFL